MDETKLAQAKSTVESQEKSNSILSLNTLRPSLKTIRPSLTTLVLFLGFSASFSSYHTVHNQVANDFHIGTSVASHSMSLLFPIPSHSNFGTKFGNRSIPPVSRIPPLVTFPTAHPSVKYYRLHIGDRERESKAEPSKKKSHHFIYKFKLKDLLSRLVICMRSS